MNPLKVLAFAFVAATASCTNGWAQQEEWESSQVLEVPPGGADMFQLNDLESLKKYSRVKNFEIVGHSYLRGPWINPAFGHVGMAINTMRICDKVAYLAGYNPIVFGVLIVDVPQGNERRFDTRHNEHFPEHVFDWLAIGRIRKPD